MFASPVLYLAVEGVLFPRTSLPPSSKAAQTFAVPPIESHVDRLEKLLDEANVSVVVNSTWVLTAGFRTVLGLFPAGIRRRTAGATIPGSKILGRRINAVVGRATWLENDLKRREPSQVTVLDFDFRYVPVRLRDACFIAERGLWRASEDDWQRLRSLLMRRGEEV